MRRTRIKFCGITRPQDALAAAAAGADAIGLNFYAGSSRYVTVTQAREILNVLPPMVTPVGLFVNHKPSEIREIAGQLNLRTVQLHGDEPPEYLAELHGLSVIKAVPFDSKSISHLQQIWKQAAGLLMDTVDTGQQGGTGVQNDWDAMESVIFDGVPLIAAGGLTPENVGDVVRRLRPWAVDVSTGIEEFPGMKSIDKMRRFAAAVGDADAAGSL